MKKADGARSAKSLLLSPIVVPGETAHQIRESLGAVLLGVKAVLKGDLNKEDLQQVVSVLEGESRRITKILADLDLRRGKQG